MYKIMFRLIRKRWLSVAGILLSGMAIVISTVSIPLFLGRCYQVFEGNVFLGIPFALLAGGYLVRAVFKLVRNQLAAGLGNHVVMEIRTLLCGILPEHSSVYAYSLLSYDVESINQMISWRPFVLLENIAIVLCSFVCVEEISSSLFYSMLALLLAAFVTGWLYSRRIHVTAGKVKQSVFLLSDCIYEDMEGQKLIRTMGKRSYFDRKFSRANRENQKWNLSLSGSERITVLLLGACSYLAMIAAVLFGGIAVVREGLPMASIVTGYSYMVVLTGTVNSLPGNIFAFVEAIQGIIRLNEFFGSRISEYTKETSQEHLFSEIILSDVTAEKEGHRLWTLSSLALKKGKLTVVTGRSGCGKTVLCDMLAGFHRDYQGRVEVGFARENSRNSYRDLDWEWMRNRLGYALQNAEILEGTIMDNISMGREDAADVGAAGIEEEKVLLACDIPGIEERYQGQELTGLAKSLSGGERQRISIARALWGQPQLVILDDVFTALDEERRTKIIDLLQEQKRDKIILVVSNYADVRQAADCIVELDQGRTGIEA